MRLASLFCLSCLSVVSLAACAGDAPAAPPPGAGYDTAIDMLRERPDAVRPQVTTAARACLNGDTPSVDLPPVYLDVMAESITIELAHEAEHSAEGGARQDEMLAALDVHFDKHAYDIQRAYDDAGGSQRLALDMMDQPGKRDDMIACTVDRVVAGDAA